MNIGAPAIGRVRRWQLFIVICLLARLATLGSYPLTDMTEARYAEIARKMADTGQWLVPQIDYGVPFWGKPPLSMWMTASSFEVLGVSEWAARLPSLLTGMLVMILVGSLAQSRRSMTRGWRAAGLAGSSLIAVVCYGAVMTDPALVLGLTLCMVAAWRVMHGNALRWRLALSAGLVVGLLAKGPLAVVLCAAPIAAWGMFCSERRRALGLFWLPGVLLTAALVVPWYVAAELKSPGFLNYFLIGEHWQRYTVSGWSGDLYGSGHPRPLGTIWAYALLGLLPWVPWLITLAIKNPASVKPSNDGGYGFYLLCWLLAPLAFFSLSKNVLPTYVLPCVAATALLIDYLLDQRTRAASTGLLWAGMAVPALLVGFLIYAPRDTQLQTQRDMMLFAKEMRKPVVYLGQRPPSAHFYSAGEAQQTDSVDELGALLRRAPDTLVATDTSRIALLKRSGLPLHQIYRSRAGKYVLLSFSHDEKPTMAHNNP